ncbi:uncharacterized protein LOC121049231 [Rosa chinensis]|nr:uncharacterized protein LOC121049231 [Rosa chinensis]
MELVQQSHPHPKASVTQVTAYGGSPSPIKQLQPIPNEADRKASFTGTHDAIVVSSVAAEVDQFSDVEEELNNFNNNQKRQQDAFLNSFPPGYRFNPRDDELVRYYLQKKIMDEPLPPNKIMEVNLYRHNPETLAERYETYGEKEWYFFTPRDRKYRNGFRPNRAAGDGYWKATGADKTIRSGNVEVGCRKALVFYRGKPPKGKKTNWIMHEYRVPDSPDSRPPKRTENDMRLDNWVLCRIYKKADNKNNKSQSRNHVEDPVEESVSTSLPDNMDMDLEANGQVDNPQALESEKAYPYPIVHPPLEFDRAYPNYAFPYPGGRPLCALVNNNMNNMLHHHRFQPVSLNSGDSYANMGQMQQACGTYSPMQFPDQNCGVQFSDQKRGVQFSDQRFIMQPVDVTSGSMVCTDDQKCGVQFPDEKFIMQSLDVTSESMVCTDEACSDQKCGRQFPDQKFIVQSPDGSPKPMTFSQEKSGKSGQPDDAVDSRPSSVPPLPNQKSTQQGMGKPLLPPSDQGLRYVEESNEDHNLMFGYPPFASLETFSWP